MIRDRDGLNESQVLELEKNRRIRCLKRRHIENYFLDPELLFIVAQRLYLTSSAPDLSVDLIKQKIRDIAEKSLMFNVYQNVKDHLTVNHFLHAPKVKDIQKKAPEKIREELISSISINRDTLSSNISDEAMRSWILTEETRLQTKLLGDDWIKDFQGKYIFNLVCGEVLKTDPIRVRQAYVDIALAEKIDIFKEVIDLFENM